jgi:glycerate dehydrogenase
MQRLKKTGVMHKVWMDSYLEKYPRAVFLDTDWYGPDISLDGLKKLPLDWAFYPDTLSSEMIERLSGAQIAIGKAPSFTKETFAALPDLKLICVASNGVNSVDLHAARDAGVTVCNTPGYSTFSVAQHTMLLILALSVNYLGEARTEAPSRYFYGYPVRELRGKTLGIIGFGNIGREVARLSMAFGMKIIIAEHKERHRSLRDALPLETVLQEADYITLHAPLTPATQHLISKRELSLMKNSACLINTSRGGLIDELDLAEALKQGLIAGAALDVLSEEPPPSDHPLLNPEVPNLLLTPHIAWSSKEARMRLIQMVEQNLVAFLDGNPLNEITVEDAGIQIAGVL